MTRVNRVFAIAAIALVLTLGAMSASAAVAGRINIEGSTTVLPVVQRLAEEFMAVNKGVKMSIRGGGSGNGITALIDSRTNIGMSSRFVKMSEIKSAVAKDVYLVPIRIAIDGIAAVVHPSNSVQKLTVAQLKSIYAGEVTNWNQVGGPNLKIVVVARDSSSGTYETWNELIMGGAKTASTALVQASNGAVADLVSRTPGGIGYVSLGYVSSKLKALPVATGTHYVAPTVSNVQRGTYPLNRDLFVFTNGWPQGEVKQFINFVLGSDGQKVVEDEGFIPLW